MSAKPYQGTVVAAERSQAEVDALLTKRGVTDIRWTSTATLKVLEFHHPLREVIGQTKSYERCPVHGKYHPRSAQHPLYKVRAVLGVRVVVALPADDAERRRLMRVLFWMLKSKFEIVDAGLAVFEEEWMAYLTLGQGRRVYDGFKPFLEQKIADGVDLSAGIGHDGLLAIAAKAAETK
ncbi:MAG: hypothetical protein M3O91_09740 [Chloroflexota bacterium]|nr:hypothetical protein [Chloroflexota bacterium]